MRIASDLARETSHRHLLGDILREDSTRCIYRVRRNSPLSGTGQLGVFISKPLRIGGYEVPESGIMMNEVTCNLFLFLKACGLPVAFEEQDSNNSFVAEICEPRASNIGLSRERWHWLRTFLRNCDLWDVQMSAESVLRRVWLLEDGKMADFTIECGFNSEGRAVVTDILLRNDEESDPREVESRLRELVEVTERFKSHVPALAALFSNPLEPAVAI